MAAYVTKRSKIKIQVSQAAINPDDETKGLFLNSEKIVCALKVSACSFFACLWPAPAGTVSPNRRTDTVFYTSAKQQKNKPLQRKPSSISSTQVKLSLSPDH